MKLDRKEAVQWGTWFPWIKEEPSLRDMLENMLFNIPNDILNRKVGDTDLRYTSRPPSPGSQLEIDEGFVSYKLWVKKESNDNGQ